MRLRQLRTRYGAEWPAVLYRAVEDLAERISVACGVGADPWAAKQLAGWRLAAGHRLNLPGKGKRRAYPRSALARALYARDRGHVSAEMVRHWERGTAHHPAWLWPALRHLETVPESLLRKHLAPPR